MTAAGTLETVTTCDSRLSDTDPELLWMRRGHGPRLRTEPTQLANLA
jgi:hypothetical protein